MARLDEAKAELADAESELGPLDENVATALVKKEEAAAAYEKAKEVVRAANAERDPVRIRVMALQREIGQIEGIPELRVSN